MLFESWKRKYISHNGLEKTRIAIMYQIASYWPTIESFYEACVDDEDVDVCIFFVSETSVEKAQVEGSERFLMERNIPFLVYSEEELKKYNPHVALYQPPYDVSYRNPEALSFHLMQMGIRIVYIPYGIEIADTEDAHYNHFNTFVIRNAWRIYTFSDVMREDYVNYCPNRHAVRALGIPKFDSLAHRAEVDGQSMTETAAGRKIILWKMHFPKLIFEGTNQRQVTPYMEEYIDFAAQIEKYADIYFVVMPHPMFFSQTINNELARKAEKLFNILKTKENVFIDRSADYRNSLYHADAIIVDRSAVMVEAGFLDVPVLYMKNADYEEPLTKAVKVLVDSYEQGITSIDMQNFVENFTHNKLEAVTERIKQSRQSVIPFEIGMCGKNILNDIKKGIMESEESTIKLAFFGASFICEHYLDRLGINNNRDFEIVCLSDNNSKKWGKKWCGIDVVSPEELKKMDIDLIVITSEQYFMSIKKGLVYDLYLDEEKIMRLDQFAEIYVKAYSK